MNEEDEMELALSQHFGAMGLDVQLSQSPLEHSVEAGKNWLKHHGVKGMKWGVRHDPGHEGEQVKAKKLNKLDNKWGKSIYSVQGAVAVHNAMAEHFNSRIGAINDRHPEADIFDKPDSPESKAYMDEVTALETKSYTHAVTSVHGSSPSGKKQAVYVEDENGARIEVRNASDVKHADDMVEHDLVLLLKRDSKGRILEMNKAQLAVAHSDEAEQFLAHHGVKGMKWGVRKKDTNPVEVSSAQKKPGTFLQTKGGQNQPAHEDAVTAAVARQKAKASTTDALSNKELQAVVNRMNLEQQYSNLMFQSDRRSAGQKFIAGFMGKKRYNGEKRKFSDEVENAGEKVRKLADDLSATLDK